MPEWKLGFNNSWRGVISGMTLLTQRCRYTALRTADSVVEGMQEKREGCYVQADDICN